MDVNNDKQEYKPETLPEIMTVEEASRFLRINRKSLYEAIRNGEISGVIRVGRSIRILKSAVLESGHG